MANKRGRTVDFSGTESSGKVPAGEYLAEVVEVEEDVGEDSGEPYIRWTFEISDGKYEGMSPRPFITSLQSHALFSLRNLLEALGVKVPNSKMKLVYDDYIGLEAGISVETEEYDGRKQSNIVDIFPAEEMYYEEEVVEEDELEEDEYYEEEEVTQDTPKSEPEPDEAVEEDDYMDDEDLDFDDEDFDFDEEDLDF